MRGECGFDGVLNCAVLDGADKLMSRLVDGGRKTSVEASGRSRMKRRRRRV